MLLRVCCLRIQVSGGTVKTALQQFAPELLLKVATCLVQRVASAAASASASSSSSPEDGKEPTGGLVAGPGGLVAGPGGCVSLGPGDVVLDHALRRLEQQPRSEQVVVQTGLRAKPNSSLRLKEAVELGNSANIPEFSVNHVEKMRNLPLNLLGNSALFGETGANGKGQPQEEGCFS